MKTLKLLLTFFIVQLLAVQFAFSTDIPSQEKVHFHTAKQELIDMLEGKKPMSYEKAIIIIENAYWDNNVNLNFFNHSIDFHLQNIQKLIEVNRDYSKQDFKRTLLETEEQKIAKYERALANWAIFSYMTDTTFFVGQDKLFYSLPFSYSVNDPLGTVDWSNTQVFNLLDTKTGNCFALVSLFKIFSERLNSKANICTAPGHIYIRHADHKGIHHNVELATRAFPGTGSMETLTYTTDDATKNGISLRELDLKQSVALCLVYLAKGYEYKFKTRDDNFLLECAELTLKYDSLNLNAMLLKAEVMEERLINKNKTVAQLQSDKDFIEYEKYINYLFSLGYREMPMDMKNLVISRLRNEDSPYPVKDHTPKPYEHLGVKDDRYFTLSGGLFDEMMITKPIEQYHRTHFDTRKKKIVKFVPVDTLYNKYPIDLVVFAWQIDPLAHKFSYLSPYSAFNNNPIFYVDPDGRSGVAYKTNNIKQSTGRPVMKVVSNYYIYGEAASDARKSSIENDLNSNYNKGFTFTDNAGTTYDVVFEFSVKVIDGSAVNSMMKEFNAENNFFEVRTDIADSYTLTGPYGGNAGVFKASDIDANIGTASHEANHGFGGKNHPDLIGRDINKGDEIDITIPQNSTYSTGGKIDMTNRKVTQQNVTDILKNVNFDKNGRGEVGTARPYKYDKEKGYTDVRNEE